MELDLPINFLREKIEELQHALFFSDSDSLLRIPTHVISVAATDEEAQIWFELPRPAQCIRQFEKSIPARLDFFKKGKDFYLKIRGKASIVLEEVEMQPHISEEILKRVQRAASMIMRVKISHADYFESTPKTSQNWIKHGGTQFYNWLLNSQYDSRNPQWIAIPITLEDQTQS
jgi:hypothetical protein